MNTRRSLRSAPRYCPVWQIILTRLREAYRQPETIFWVYGFPVLLIISLGVAFRDQAPELVVVDVQQGPRARQVLDILQRSKRTTPQLCDAAQCRRRLRTGRTDVVVVPAGQSPPRYVYRFDPTRPQSVLARNAVDDILQRAAGRADAAVFTDAPMTQPGGRYIDFLIPGMLGLSLMGGGMWGVGFATVDLRIRKLLKRFVATPMKKSHFLMGMLLSRIFFIIPEMVLILGFARLAFGVVVHGAWAAVAVLIFVGAWTFAGIGLLVASRAQTLEAVSGLMNLVMLPMWVLSGVFFSSERFPAFAQPLIQTLPLTPLLEALRSVMLEGAPLSSQLTHIGILALWGAVTFALALRWFRWT